MRPITKPVHFLLQLFFPLLAVAVTMATSSCGKGVAPPIDVHGEVGGSVIFNCSSATDPDPELMYFQRGETYINGFHLTRIIPTATWENTKVDKAEKAVLMSNLTVSHEGLYCCHMGFTDKDQLVEIPFRLNLRAPYSIISHSEQCDEGNRACRVTCWAHGGYPRAEMTFNVTGSGGNSSEERDPSTFLFNSSRSATFRCSGEALPFQCSVGGSTSDVISVCGHQKPFDLKVIFAILGVVVFLALMGTILWIWRKGKCGKPNRAKEHEGNTEEQIQLK